MADHEAGTRGRASSLSSRGRPAEGSRVEPLRLRGTDRSVAFAPSGPSGERDFLAERLALFGRIACPASSGFLVMRLVLNALAKQGAGRHSPLESFPFGLVKEVNESENARLTREDVFAGTLHYLAPETIEAGSSPDPRSDLYALGAVAYYLLTGGPVFDGLPVQVIQSHLQVSPEPPSVRLGRPLPAKLESIVLDCLQKDPNRRPESAQALMDRFAACDDVEPWVAEEARKWWRARKTA